jgi:hypothetical protein
MALETSTYIDGLVPTNPVATDGLSQSDDHHRLIKSTIKATFPNVAGAITDTHTVINTLDPRLTVQETAVAVQANNDIQINPQNTGVVIIDSLTWPNADGTVGQFLKTDGAGNLSFDTVNSSLVGDPAPTLGADLDTDGNAITFGSWTISLDGSNQLVFAYLAM